MEKKDLKENKKEKNQKNDKKVFTKKKGKDIISSDYNPLKVNYRKIYQKGSELHMEDKELEIARRLSKKYNEKEMVFLTMIKKCKRFGYNIEESEALIKEFKEEVNCY